MTSSHDDRRGADRFVVAVRREARVTAPADWLDRVREIPGITIVGDANPSRVTIRATPDAIDRLRDALSDCLHIERLIVHERS